LCSGAQLVGEPFAVWLPSWGSTLRAITAVANLKRRCLMTSKVAPLGRAICSVLSSYWPILTQLLLDHPPIKPARGELSQNPSIFLANGCIATDTSTPCWIVVCGLESIA
jgi:hypothetical protein